MGDEALVRVLATLPPSKWSKAMQSYPVLAGYLRIEHPTTLDADVAAQRLGVKRRMFYHLAHGLRDALETPAPVRVQADSRALDPKTLRIVDDTVAEIGAIASEAEIHRLIRERCETAGVPLHSDGVVRTRLGRLRHKDVGKRLGVSADLILDACALEVGAFKQPGEVAAAGLIAVVDVTTGAIVSHEVAVGRPSRAESMLCVSRAMNLASRPIETIRQTSNVEVIDQASLCPFGLKQDISRTRYVKGGMPLTVVLGPRLGRIALRPRNKLYAAPKCGTPMDLTTISAVVSFLIEARNRELS